MESSIPRVIFKKVVVCDLDGTLAESKSKIQEDMVLAIIGLLSDRHFAVISGGDLKQFSTQFISPFMEHLSCGDQKLTHLLLFPTSGAECRMYDVHTETWRQVYDKVLFSAEKEKIKAAFTRVLEKLDSELYVGISEVFGERLEDRGEQITFSGCGQEAPLQVKSIWDPDQYKRKKIVQELKEYIPEFEITIGGTTSIDVTQKGIHKAYAIERIKEILFVHTEDILFIGDALYPGGNDAIARQSGVECMQVSGPNETIEVLRRLVC